MSNSKSKPTLGGSIFVRNAIEFDYCIDEAVSSLCALCDEVVVLDAESDDGTLKLLVDLADKHSNLIVVAGEKWECASDFNRLNRLANKAKNYLDTEWHFMLQADEVIHESSFEPIRRAIESKQNRSYLVRRLNLAGDVNHCLRFDAPAKPCSDEVIRLATIESDAFSDAESLRVDPRFVSSELLGKATIFHYGYVRRDDAMLRKCRDMQSWFRGQCSQVDPRLHGMEKVFDWRAFWPREHLMNIPMEHPIFSRNYASSRQSLKTIPV